MLFFNANFICYYFYPTKKREEPLILIQELLEDPLQQMQFNFNLIMGNSYIRLLAPQ